MKSTYIHHDWIEFNNDELYVECHCEIYCGSNTPDDPSDVKDIEVYRNDNKHNITVHLSDSQIQTLSNNAFEKFKSR
jgi:hypothetical protein